VGHSISRKSHAFNTGCASGQLLLYDFTCFTYYIYTGCASGQVLLYDLGPAKARIAKKASAGSVQADAGALKEEASKIVKHVMASSIGIRMCSPP
jgi:hypothetical protein